MPALRLARILNELRRERSYQDFAEEIQQTATDATGQNLTIDYRKIREICDPESVKTKSRGLQISLKYLEAIDAYLRQHGMSLSRMPLFESESILDSLVEPGAVTAYVALRSHERRDFISAWDARALALLVHNINQLRPDTRFAFQNVPVQTSHTPVLPATRMGHSHGPESICCIGTPQSCHMSEHVIAEMFGVQPFMAPARGAARQLPVYFVWGPDEEARVLESCCALDAGDISRRDFPAKLPNPNLPLLISNERARAVVIGNNIYSVIQTGKGWDEYGVILAQRQVRGHLAVVIAGVSGPGTFIAAKLLPQLPPVGENDQRVMIALVRATVRQETKKKVGDKRALLDDEAGSVESVTYWSP